MRFYYYIFYRWYFLVNLIDDGAPQLYATAQCALMDFLVSSSLYLLLSRDSWSHLFQASSGALVAISLLSMFFLLNYYIFLYKGRYRRIIKSFEGESVAAKLIGTVSTLLFFAFLAWIAVKLQYMSGVE